MPYCSGPTIVSEVSEGHLSAMNERLTEVAALSGSSISLM
jgi:hypothetical protein